MSPRRVKDILWVFAVLGLAAIVVRFATGLGASTDLSDGVPWGLWKVVNMIAGVALATGGFVLALGGHVLGIRSLKPLVRPGILVAFLGYSASCTALLMDIGLPHRFWHPFFFWNVHSFLFEVFWCVILYFTITALEITPVALENSRYRKVLTFIKKITTPIVILGISFSCMHHSSLGSLFLVSPTRLHEIWYSPWLPVHFILSAVGAGLLMVVLLTLTVGRLYRRQVPMALLAKVSAAGAIVLGVYLATRVGDLLARGALAAVFAGTWEANLFLVEIASAAVLPIAMIAWPGVRRSSRGLAIAALFAAFGLVLNRVDVGILGFLRSGAVSYAPTLAEILLTLGIPAMAGLAFLYFVERFRVFELGEPLDDPANAPTVCSFERQTNVWTGAFMDPLQRVSLIVVILVPVAALLFSGSAGARTVPPQPVQGPQAADALRHVLKVDGDRDGDLVTFAHEDHKQRLGGEASCAKCHHLDEPGDRYPSCQVCHSDMHHTRSIFDHDGHAEHVAKKEGFSGSRAGNRSCVVCHEEGQPRTGDSAKACVSCHEEDMRMPTVATGRPEAAIGYMDAMHGSCVPCHEERAEEAKRPDLAACATCHGPAKR